METRTLHVQMLQEEFTRRRKRSAAYSMRAFARDLGVSAAHLSCLLKEKKGLSELKARALSRRIGLSRTQTRAFLASLTATFSRSHSMRIDARKYLEGVQQAVAVPVQLSTQDFDQVHNWYYFAILELTEMADCGHRPEWFAERLNIDAYVAREAIDRLLKMKMLVFEDGRYRASQDESYTPSDISSAAGKRYHRDLMKRAEQALSTQSVLEREFINLTFSFPTSRIREAKEYLRDMQNQFIDRFCMNEEAEPRAKNSVHHLSLQFFRLDQKQGDL